MLIYKCLVPSLLSTHPFQWHQWHQLHQLPQLILEWISTEHRRQEDLVDRYNQLQDHRLVDKIYYPTSQDCLLDILLQFETILVVDLLQLHLWLLLLQ